MKTTETPQGTEMIEMKTENTIRIVADVHLNVEMTIEETVKVLKSAADMKTQGIQETTAETTIVASEVIRENVHHITIAEAEEEEEDEVVAAGLTSNEDSTTRKRTMPTLNGESATLSRTQKSRPWKRTNQTLDCLESSQKRRIKSMELLSNTQNRQKQSSRNVGGDCIHSRVKLLYRHFTSIVKAHI